MCLSAFAVASFVQSPFSGFITRLACPASARTSAQLAGFSLLASASQSLLIGRHLHPVFVIGFPRLQSLSTGVHSSFQIHYQTDKMVSVASTSATMDLTAVLPALMEGIAQEVGVDMNELKMVLVGDETQLDVKPFQILREQYHQVEWDYKKLDQLHNPEPYVEIGLKQDAPLLQSYNTRQQQLAFDVKGSERWTSGERPVDLYQVGSYGSCLSALRSRLVCAMEGVFNSKGAV